MSQAQWGHLLGQTKTLEKNSAYNASDHQDLFGPTKIPALTDSLCNSILGNILVTSISQSWIIRYDCNISDVYSVHNIPDLASILLINHTRWLYQLLYTTCFSRHLGPKSFSKFSMTRPILQGPTSLLHMSTGLPRVNQPLDMGNGWVGPYNPGHMCLTKHEEIMRDSKV